MGDNEKIEEYYDNIDENSNNDIALDWFQQAIDIYKLNGFWLDDDNSINYFNNNANVVNVHKWITKLTQQSCRDNKSPIYNKNEDAVVTGKKESDISKNNKNDNNNGNNKLKQ